jgi:DNA-binding NarL/FixJ family response regulator
MMPVSMVGRTDELEELVRAWSGVAARSIVAATAVITGDAGVGKSMLVASALARLTPRPAAVLSGTARVHAPAPYDWLAAVLSGRDTAALPIPDDALAWLSQHPDAHAERYAPGALLRMAVRTVRALIGTGPAVLIVEDLHALDPASLNLVGELAAAPDLPALLLVTSQAPDAAVSPALAARTLARLGGAAGAIRQHLGSLTSDDIGAILAEVYPHREVRPEAVRAVREETGGNPYRIRELLVAARAQPAHTYQWLPHQGLQPHLKSQRPAQEPPPDQEPQNAGAKARRRQAVRSRRSARSEPAGELAAGPSATLPGLTARETEVLSCLAVGMSNKQVARSLGISIRTVAVHVSNLLRKTRSASRTEAALWAVKHHLIRPSAP